MMWGAFAGGVLIGFFLGAWLYVLPLLFAEERQRRKGATCLK